MGPTNDALAWPQCEYKICTMFLPYRHTTTTTPRLVPRLTPEGLVVGLAP